MEMFSKFVVGISKEKWEGSLDDQIMQKPEEFLICKHSVCAMSRKTCSRRLFVVNGAGVSKGYNKSLPQLISDLGST